MYLGGTVTSLLLLVVIGIEGINPQGILITSYPSVFIIPCRHI